MARPDAEDEGFLSRWSRRKAEEAQRQPPDDAAAPESSDALAAPARSAEPSPESPSEPLPDPETLGRDANWSRFLKADVPAALRTRALRRLWRLDPVFANLDGLVDYAEDYNDPALFGGPVKSLYQVGRGMLVGEQPARIPESAGEPAAEPVAESAREAAPPSVADAEQTSSASTAGEVEAEGRGGDEPPPPAERQATGEAAQRAARHGRGALARRWGVRAPPDSASRQG